MTNANDERLEIRISTVQRRHLRIAAGSHDMSMGAYVRYVLNDAVLADPVVRADMAAQVARARTDD